MKLQDSFLLLQGCAHAAMCLLLLELEDPKRAGDHAEQAVQIWEDFGHLLDPFVAAAVLGGGYANRAVCVAKSGSGLVAAEEWLSRAARAAARLGDHHRIPMEI